MSSLLLRAPFDPEQRAAPIALSVAAHGCLDNLVLVLGVHLRFCGTFLNIRGFLW
jgi:hypothetical protein